MDNSILSLDIETFEGNVLHFPIAFVPIQQDRFSGAANQETSNIEPYGKHLHFVANRQWFTNTSVPAGDITYHITYPEV